MSNPTHSPAPWELCDRGDYGDFDGNSRVILADDMRIAVVHDPGTEQAEANARLIAAAPELLTALKECLQWTHRAYDLEVSGSMRSAQDLSIRKAKTAIAAATGEGA